MTHSIDHLMTASFRNAVRTAAAPGDTTVWTGDKYRTLVFADDYDPRSAQRDALAAVRAFKVDLPAAIRIALENGDLDDNARDALVDAAQVLDDDPDADLESITGLREVASAIDAPDGYAEAVERFLLASGRILYDLDGQTLRRRNLNIETGEVEEAEFILADATDLPRQASADSRRLTAKLLDQLERTSDRYRDAEERLARLEAIRSSQIRGLRALGVGINEIGEAAGVSNAYIYARTRTRKESAEAAAGQSKRKLPSTYRTEGPGVGVAEAARRLGLSDAGVRLRARTGKLETTMHKGRLRILLPEED